MKQINILLITLLGLIMASCGEPVRIATDYAKSTDFNNYKTYAYTSEVDSLPLNDIQRKRIFSNLDKYLAEKGFSKVEKNPDVLIDVLLRVRTEEQATANTYNMGGGGYYWRGGMTTTQFDITKYKVGTMAVNMIDAEKKELVWQGIAEGTLGDQSSKNKDAMIEKAVKKMFWYYPPKNR